MTKILSLFDGIAGARQALKELNIDCKYYGAEIDKYAIQVAKANHPDIKQIGNVKGIHIEEGYIFYNQKNDPMKNGGSFKANIDLILGGSPCQNLSIAGNGEGLKGEKSSLFYEYVRILKQVKPKFFVLENVASMKKADKEAISKELWGIEPIMINSSLNTAQNRKRLYWIGKLVNGKYKRVAIDQPEDKGIHLIDILLDCPTGIKIREKSKCLRVGGRGSPFGSKQEWDSPYRNRRYSVAECCRLQGFPDDYVDIVSKTQGYKALGNSFTVPVINHILQQIFNDNLI